MPLILGTNSIKDTGYDVANSLRFDDGSSDYLNRTPSSAGNRRTFTISVWLKIGLNGTFRAIIGAGGGANRDRLQLFNNDTLVFNLDDGTGGVLESSQLLRDPSAWYHIVCAVDTTQGTASSRIKLFLNGSQITSFATETYPSQNYDCRLNNNIETFIGQSSANNHYYDGYMAEFVFIDGQALDPTSFGEFDTDTPSVFKPKNVSGLTFGTNGFYLDFENSGSLGADVSGNGNNFTVNNLTSVDQSTDTCTNNFATLNTLAWTTGSGLTFSEGNLKLVNSASDWRPAISNIAVTSGKWYAEVKVTAVGSASKYGIIDVLQYNDEGNLFYNLASGTRAWTYRAFQGKVYNNTNDAGGSSYGNSFTTNDIIGIYLDCDNNKVYWAKNGTVQNSGTGISITDGYDYAFALNLYNSTAEINFGSPTFSISSGNTDANGYGNFEYDPSSGTFDGASKNFYALNTKNLAEFG